MFYLERFKSAQNENFCVALAEVQSGKKKTHWIWYIFPQLKQLGQSYFSSYYGIENLDEAKEYLSDSTLKERLLQVCKALLNQDENNPVKILGEIDAMKVQSSMTLFEQADPNEKIFKQVLQRYYQGHRCEKTLRLLGINYGIL